MRCDTHQCQERTGVSKCHVNVSHVAKLGCLLLQRLWYMILNGLVYCVCPGQSPHQLLLQIVSVHFSKTLVLIEINSSLCRPLFHVCMKDVSPFLQERSLCLIVIYVHGLPALSIALGWASSLQKLCVSQAHIALACPAVRRAQWCWVIQDQRLSVKLVLEHFG